MKDFIFKKGALAAVAGLSLFALSACSGPVLDEDNVDNTTDKMPEDEVMMDDSEVLTLGYVGPLTGDAASFGQNEKNLIELWLSENPEIAGKRVEVIFEDGQCDSSEASKAAQKLVNVDKVSFILGGLCSGESEGILPVAETRGVLAFSSVSTSPKLSGASDSFVRNAPNDAEASSVMVDHMVAEGYSRAALLGQNNDFAQAYAEAVLPKLAEAGIEVVVEEYYNDGTTDFKTALQKVKDAEADILMNLSGDPTAGGFVTKQATELGLDLPVIGNDTLLGAEYVEIAKNATDGSFIVAVAADMEDPELSALFDRYNANYDEPPVLDGYMPLMWDRMNMLKAAIEGAGMDPMAVRSYLIDMEPFEGIAGQTDILENGDSSQKARVLVLQDGKTSIYNK